MGKLKSYCKHADVTCDKCAAIRAKTREVNDRSRSMTLAQQLAEMERQGKDRESAFWNKVIFGPDSDCWLTSMSYNNADRPQFAVMQGDAHTASTLAYAFTTGDLEIDGYEYHHTCFNIECVNPAHIEKLTHDEHVEIHRQLREEAA